MSSENPSAAADYGPSGQAASAREKQLRNKEVALQREIVNARSQGANVAKAQHQKWLGSMVLAKGDRVDAMRHFNHAERGLTVEGANINHNGPRSNDTWSDVHANETSQPSNAANMLPNNGTTAAY